MLLGLLCIAGSTRKKKLAFAPGPSTGFSGRQRLLGCFKTASHMEHHASISMTTSAIAYTDRYKSKRPESPHPPAAMLHCSETVGLAACPQLAIPELRPTACVCLLQRE